MRRFLFATVEHVAQLYPTVGNYQEGHGVTLFTDSNMHNDLYEGLVRLHEHIEYFLVKAHGIPIEEIDKFDIEYEKNRLEFDDSEPGDAENCPYRAEHQEATAIEKRLAQLVGVDWEQYDKTVREL